MTNRVRTKLFHGSCKVLLAIAMVCTFMAVTWAGDEQQDDFVVLKQQFDEANENKDHSKALEIVMKMNEITEPRHYETLYDIASLHALLGNNNKAYEYLNKAIDAGFWNIQQLRQDEDFASIREETYFRELSRKAWSNGYLAMLERPEREEYQKKDEIMKTLELKPGQRVADIGAGSGYFTIPVAKAVGPTGKVWAIDIFQEMLTYIDRRLKAEQLENVELLKVERDDPQLPPAGVDMILMVDTYHYIQNRTEYAKKLREGLAPGGQVVVIDFIPKPWEERPWGPPPEQHLSKEMLNSEMAEAGLKVVKDHDFLPEQYFVVYEAQ